MWQGHGQGDPRPQDPLPAHRCRGHPRRRVHLRDARAHRDDQQDVRRPVHEHLREHGRGRCARRRRSSGDFGAGSRPDRRVARPRGPQAPTGVAEADGTIQGFAFVVDKQQRGAEQDGQGAPALGFAWIESRDLSPFHLVDSRASGAARAPNQIVIDKDTAEKTEVQDRRHASRSSRHGRGELRARRHRGVRRRRRPARRDQRAVHPRDREPRVRSRRQGRRDRREGGLGRVRRSRSSSNIKQTLAGQKNIEVLTGRADHQGEPERHQGRSSAFFNTFLLVFGVIALLVGSFIIFNTFSIIVAQRSREMALLRAIGAKGGQVDPLGARSKRCSSASSRPSIGFVAGVLLAGALKARARRARRRHPGERDHHPVERRRSASFVVGHPRHGRRRGLPGDPRVAHPADRRARSGSAPTSPPGSWKRIAAGVVITLHRHRLAGLGPVRATTGSPSVGLGAFVVFIGVAILGPTIARPISAVLGLADPGA